MPGPPGAVLQMRIQFMPACFIYITPGNRILQSKSHFPADFIKFWWNEFYFNYRWHLFWLSLLRSSLFTSLVDYISHFPDDSHLSFLIFWLLFNISLFKSTNCADSVDCISLFREYSHLSTHISLTVISKKLIRVNGCCEFGWPRSRFSQIQSSFSQICLIF